MSKPKLTDEWGFYTAIPEVVIQKMHVIDVDAFAVFCYLRYRTNRDRGVAWPSYKTMVDETGLTRKRLAEALSILEGFDLLERKRRFGASTVYRLMVPPELLYPEPISPPVEPMDDAISPPVEPPLVPTGEHYPDVSTQDLKDKRGTPKNGRPRDELFDAIAETCRVDPDTAGTSVGTVRATLLKANYTPDEVRQFGKWWWGDKGMRQRPPTVWQLRELIGIVRKMDEGKPLTDKQKLAGILDGTWRGSE